MRVLVLCADPWHPAETVRRGLAVLGNAYQFEFLEDGAQWPARYMNEFPLTLLAKANLASSKIETPWLNAQSQHAFPEYVRRGHGLAVIHAGCSRYETLPAMHALIGGALVNHPDQGAVTIEPQPGHPLTRGIASFTVQDEHYFMAMSDAPADVFLHSRSAHGLQPAGWSRTEGLGRVCVLTPGHTVDVWFHPSFQKLLSNALSWTAKIN